MICPSIWPWACDSGSLSAPGSSGFWTPHSWFCLCLTWCAFSVSFAGVSLLPWFLNRYPRIWFSGAFSFPALVLFMTFVLFPLYTDVSQIYTSTWTSLLNASLLCGTTYPTAHWHLRHHLSVAATTLVHISIRSHVINCSGFLTSLLVSTFVLPQSILQMVVRMILFLCM